MSRLLAAIATTRFGMGARPGDIVAAANDARGWVKRQIRSNAALVAARGLPSTLDIIASQPFLYGIEGATRPEMGGAAQDLTGRMQAEIAARFNHAITTPNSFADRWARFWSNHLTTASRNPQMRGLVGPYEREAIRPHVFGSFASLLRKAIFHQGMLVYLDAHRSVGPSTEPAEIRNIGLNENLAREILELHTMGVKSGYTQGDIVEFAKALTGWTLFGTRLARVGAGEREPRRLRRASLDRTPGAVIYVDGLHEPGARTLLGKRYEMEGQLQAGAILDDLAVHPATARHIATKLARHFVADDPPVAAVAALEAVFNDTKGDLAALAHAVIDLDAAWSTDPGSRKFKTPDELMVSVGRAAGAQAPRAIPSFYAMLGHMPFSAPSPAGWADDTQSWAGADAIKKRLEWANTVSRRMARGDSPSAFLDQALGELAGPATRKAVSRAESAEQGFTIAIMSPEFQRR